MRIMVSPLARLHQWTVPRGNGHYRDMPAGLRGKVIHVDDTGTVHVSWENGSSLGAVHGFDRIRRVD